MIWQRFIAQSNAGNETDGAKPTKKIPWLYYGDGIEGLDRFILEPNLEFYLDISSVIEIKEKMLKKR